MAGDWIPAQVGLARKREVVMIANITERSRHEVAGLLVDFWGWASNESSDGNLVGADCRALVALVGADAHFWDAVVRAGWLQITGDGLRIPNADSWITKGAKARLANSKRQKKRRANVTNKARQKRDHRTEENSTDKYPPNPPAGVGEGELGSNGNANPYKAWELARGVLAIANRKPDPGLSTEQMQEFNRNRTAEAKSQFAKLPPDVQAVMEMVRDTLESKDATTDTKRRIFLDAFNRQAGAA